MRTRPATPPRVPPTMAAVATLAPSSVHNKQVGLHSDGEGRGVSQEVSFCISSDCIKLSTEVKYEKRSYLDIVGISIRINFMHTLSFSVAKIIHLSNPE